IAFLDWCERTGVTTRVGDMRRLRRRGGQRPGPVLGCARGRGHARGRSGRRRLLGGGRGGGVRRRVGGGRRGAGREGGPVQGAARGWWCRMGRERQERWEDRVGRYGAERREGLKRKTLPYRMLRCAD